MRLVRVDARGLSRKGLLLDGVLSVTEVVVGHPERQEDGDDCNDGGDDEQDLHDLIVSCEKNTKHVRTSSNVRAAASRTLDNTSADGTVEGVQGSSTDVAVDASDLCGVRVRSEVGLELSGHEVRPDSTSYAPGSLAAAPKELG